MCPSGSGSSELQNFVEARCGGLVTCTFVPLYQGSSTILLSHSLLFLTCHPFLDRADTRPERLCCCCCYNSIWGFFDTYTSTSLEKQIPKTFSLHHFSFAYNDKKRAFMRKPAAARLMLWLWDIQPTLEREGKRHQQTEKTVNQEWSWHVGRLLILFNIHKLKIRRIQIITAQCSTTAVGVTVWKHFV